MRLAFLASGIWNSISQKLDATKIEFANKADIFVVNAWDEGIQLDVKTTNEKIYSLTVDSAGIGYWINGERRFYISA